MKPIATPNRQTAPRYRVVCYALIGDRSEIIMDDTSFPNEGFITATGTITNATMTAELAHAGPHELQAHLALMIANDDQLAGRHSRSRRPREISTPEV